MKTAFVMRTDIVYYSVVDCRTILFFFDKNRFQFDRVMALGDDVVDDRWPSCEWLNNIVTQLGQL